MLAPDVFLVPAPPSPPPKTVHFKSADSVEKGTRVVAPRTGDGRKWNKYDALSPLLGAASARLGPSLKQEDATIG